MPLHDSGCPGYETASELRESLRSKYFEDVEFLVDMGFDPGWRGLTCAGLTPRPSPSLGLLMLLASERQSAVDPPTDRLRKVQANIERLRSRIDEMRAEHPVLFDMLWLEISERLVVLMRERNLLEQLADVHEQRIDAASRPRNEARDNEIVAQLEAWSGTEEAFYARHGANADTGKKGTAWGPKREVLTAGALKGAVRRHRERAAETRDEAPLRP